MTWRVDGDDSVGSFEVIERRQEELRFFSIFLESNSNHLVSSFIRLLILLHTDSSQLSIVSTQLKRTDATKYLQPKTKSNRISLSPLPSPSNLILLLRNFHFSSLAILAPSANSINKSNSPLLRQSSENSEDELESRFQGVSYSNTQPGPRTRILSMSIIVRSRLSRWEVSFEFY